MPTFEIQNPQTGQILEIDGPNMPSEQEMNEIFGATSGEGPSPMGMSPGMPAPPQEKSFGGFLGNVMTDAGSEIGGAVKGIASIPGAMLGAAKSAYEDPAGIPGRLAGGISSAASGLKDYAAEYVNHPLDTLYEHPVRALTDISMLAGVGEMVAPGRAASMAGKVSKMTNLPGAVAKGTVKGAARAARMPARAVGDTVSRIGASARNDAFMKRTVNPIGFEKQVLDSTGAAVKNDILTKKADTFRELEGDYNRILGPQGGTETASIPHPPNLNPDPPNLQRGRSADARWATRNAPPELQNAGRPRTSTVPRQVTTSTDTPLAKAQTPQVSTKKFNKAEVTSVEPGQTFRDMHNEAQGLRGFERKAVQGQMKSTAASNGLTREADEYFATGEKWSKAHEQFENRFVKHILNNPDEAIAGLFEKGNQPTYQPRGTKSIYSGPSAKTFSNKELVDQLRSIVKPDTMDRLRAKIGDDIRRNATSASGSVSPTKIHTTLEKLDKAGVVDELVPNHQILREIAKVLEKDKKSAFWTAPGTKGWIRDVTHAALRKTHLEQPDIERLVKLSRKQGHPTADKIADILSKGSLVGAASQHGSAQE